MYTQCPDCQTRFRVTAGALRAAHGTVRCGRCGSAFDALPHLTDAVPRARRALPAPPIDLRSEAGFGQAEIVDLAPVIEAELARLDEAEFAGLDASDFAGIGEPAADSTVVLVDEGGAGEDITLEGEEVKVEGLLEPQPRPELQPEPPADLQREAEEVRAAGEPAPAAEQEPGAGEVEEEFDLDATDRFEVLRIPASAYPDPQEAEREFEALVQRLQRAFDERIAPVETAGEHEEDTAQTEALAQEPFVDQTAILEPLSEEPETAVLEAPVVEPGAAAPEPAAAPAPESGIEPRAPAAPVVEALAGLQAQTGAPSVAAMASPAPAEAPAREAAVVVPVGERPLSARRWQPPPEELEAEAAPARSVAGVIAWSIGSLLLALVLTAQVVHHFRQELARDARFGPTLRSAYERLGIDLPPSRDLAALELRQSGDDERGGGRMVVRASLTNRASFAQPLPVLRLQFEDRYGVMIGTRDFEPADYAKDAASAGRLLAPGGSSEAELALADPGADAVGYRLEICQRESPTRLLCARGPG